MADSNCACVRELQDGGCENLRHCARLNTLLIQMISRWHILNNKVDLTKFFSKKTSLWLIAILLTALRKTAMVELYKQAIATKNIAVTGTHTCISKMVLQHNH